jgi:hypothetical protein
MATRVSICVDNGSLICVWGEARLPHAAGQ